MHAKESKGALLDIYNLAKARTLANTKIFARVNIYNNHNNH